MIEDLLGRNRGSDPVVFGDACHSFSEFGSWYRVSFACDGHCFESVEHYVANRAALWVGYEAIRAYRADRGHHHLARLRVREQPSLQARQNRVVRQQRSVARIACLCKFTQTPKLTMYMVGTRC